MMSRSPIEKSERSKSSSRRSSSPYHVKCIPPYCDEAQADKTTVAKLQRKDLEDRYIVACDENNSQKRLVHDLNKQLKRLSVRAQRKQPGKAFAQCEEEIINNLTQQNRMLQAKVNVLTLQLRNHSRMHARLHGSLSAKESSTVSPTRNQSNVTSDRDSNKSQIKKEHSGNYETDQLKHRIRTLEQELDKKKVAYERRIAELEVNCPPSFQRSDASADDDDVDRVMDNVEIIRLRRLNKRQAAQIAALTDHVDAAEKELASLRKNIEQSNSEAAELIQKLQQEKQKLKSSQQEAAHTKAHAEAVKALEEEVLDLKKERASLKDHNDKLLRIASQHNEDKTQLKTEKEVPTLKADKAMAISETETNLKKEESTFNSSSQVKYTRKRKLSTEDSDSNKTSEETSSVKSDKKTPVIVVRKGNSTEFEGSQYDGYIIVREISSTRLEKCDEDVNTIVEKKKTVENVYPKDDANIVRNELKTKPAESPLKEINTYRLPSIKCVCSCETNEDVTSLNEAYQLQEKVDGGCNCKCIYNVTEVRKGKSDEDLYSKDGDSIVEKELKTKPDETSLEEISTHSPQIRKSEGSSNKEDEEIILLNEKIAALLKELNEAKRNAGHNKRCDCNIIEAVNVLSQGYENSENLESKLENAFEEITRLRKLLKEAMSHITSPVCRCNRGSQTEDTVVRYELNADRKEENTISKSLTKMIQSSTDMDNRFRFRKLKRPPKKHHLICLEKRKKRRAITSVRDYINVKEQIPSVRNIKPVVLSKESLSESIGHITNRECNNILSTEEKSTKVISRTELNAENALKSRVSNTTIPLEHDCLEETFKKRSNSEVRCKFQEIQPVNHINEDKNRSVKKEDGYEKNLMCGCTCKMSPNSTILGNTAEPVTVTDERRMYGQSSGNMKNKSVYTTQHNTSEIPVQESISKNFKISKPIKKCNSAETKSGSDISHMDKYGISFKICMISVKVDNISFKNLMTFDTDPHIYLTCTFLGVEKQTEPIKPLRQVNFDNCVFVYGLTSQPVIQHSFEHGVKVVCYILKRDGSSVYVAQGHLDLSTTLANPEVMVYRFIDLMGKGVRIELYCNFCLSYCSHLHLPTPGPEVPDEDKEQNNLVVKIEGLKLNSRSKLLRDENVSHIYVEYSFLGLKGQNLETKSLPKNQIMNFRYSKNFTNEVINIKKVHDRLKKMLQPESHQVLQFLIISEPSSEKEDVRECVELGFAEVNLYTSMILKEKNLKREKLPVFSMDGKSNYGSLIVSVYGIELMRQTANESVLN